MGREAVFEGDLWFVFTAYCVVKLLKNIESGEKLQKMSALWKKLLATFAAGA